MKCSNCFHENSDNVNYCSNCGTPCSQQLFYKKTDNHQTFAIIAGCLLAFGSVFWYISNNIAKIWGRSDSLDIFMHLVGSSVLLILALSIKNNTWRLVFIIFGILTILLTIINLLKFYIF